MKNNVLFFFLAFLCLFVASSQGVEPTDELWISDSLAPICVKSEFVFKEAPFSSCHASTIAETLDGTLVVACFGGTREGAGDVAIWGARLPKDATSWSSPQVVGDADGDDVPCWNPVLFQPSEGALRLFFKQGKEIAKWQGVLVSSTDGGQTWQDRRVLPEFFIGPVKNKPVELADGTILCPSSTEHDGWRVHFERIPAFDKTWSRTEAVNVKEEGGAIQPSVLFHRDGRLQAICRNKDGNGKLWSFWSEDAGLTWSRMEPLNLPNPCSGTDAVTLQDGRQLLVYNHSNVKTGGRNILNVAVSENGVDWNAVCILENAPGEYSYPAVIQTKDGLVHIVYTWRRERIKRVVLDPKKIVGVPIVDAVWPKEVK